MQPHQLLRLLCSFTLGFLLCFPAHLQAEEPETKPQTTTDELARQFIEEFLQDHPDRILVIGILDHGKQTFYSAGTTSSGSKPSQQTLFELGSITKVFTGIALASLVNEGAVELDQTIRTLIPAENKLADPIGNITLKQLATHTSGLPRVSLSTQLKSLVSRQPYGSTRQQLYANLAMLKKNEPTKSPEYSNYGVSLLGDLIAKVEGKTFEQVVIDRICTPLNLHNTLEHLNEDQQLLLAPGYFQDDPQKPWSEMGVGVAAGGFRSSTQEMLQFAAAVLNPPKNALGEAIQLSLQPLVKKHGREIRVGLCWHMVSPEGHGGDPKANGELKKNDPPKPQKPLTYYHNGSTFSHRSGLHIVPEYDFAVVVFVNETLSDILNPDFVAYKLIETKWQGE